MRWPPHRRSSSLFASPPSLHFLASSLLLLVPRTFSSFHAPPLLSLEALSSASPASPVVSSSRASPARLLLQGFCRSASSVSWALGQLLPAAVALRSRARETGAECPARPGRPVPRECVSRVCAVSPARCGEIPVPRPREAATAGIPGPGAVRMAPWRLSDVDVDVDMDVL